MTTAGTYTVTVTNPATGCASISDPFVVVVDDESAPAVSIVAEDGVDTLTCDVNRTVLIATVDGDDTDLLYTWSGGNNPDQARNGVTTAGTYTVTVTNPATGCESISEPFTVEEIEGGITIDSIDGLSESRELVLGCGTNTTTLVPAISGAGSYTYQWIGPGVNETTTTLTLSDTNQAGEYSLTVEDPRSGCSTPFSFTVSISTGDLGAVITAGEDATTAENLTVCQNEAVTLTVRVDDEASSPLNYLWSTGSTDPTINPDVSTIGEATYTVTVTDAAGCSQVVSQLVTVRDMPQFTLTVLNGEDNVFCAGEALVIEASDPSLEYAWSGPDGTAEANTFTFPDGLTVDGETTEYTIDVRGSAGNTECSFTSSITITIVPNPEVTVGQEGVRFERGFGGRFTAEVNVGEDLTHAWTLLRPDGSVYLESSGATTPIVTFDTAGDWTIECRSTDPNGCTQLASITETVSEGSACVASFRITGSSADNYCPLDTYTITDQSRDGSTQPQRINRATYTFVNASGPNTIEIDGESYPDGIITLEGNQSSANLNEVAFMNPGAWTIVMTVDNGEAEGTCTASDSVSISVSESPVLDAFELITNETCAGEPASLVARVSGTDRYRLTYRIAGSSSEISFEFSGQDTTTTFAPDGAVFEATRLENLTTGCSAPVDLDATTPLTLRGEPEVTDVTPTCVTGADSYSVSFQVTTFGEVDFTVNGETLPSGSIYTSENISSAEDFSFTVEDARGCTETITGTAPDCDCQTVMGTWADLRLCQSEDIALTAPSDFRSDGNDLLVYTLYAARGGERRTVAATEPLTPMQTATFPAIGADYSAETVYTIEVEAGDALDGGINPDDPCRGSATVAVSIAASTVMTFATEEDLTVCRGDSASVKAIFARPQDARLVEVQYFLTVVNDDGSTENPTLITVTIDTSGEYEVLNQVVNRPTRLELSEIKTTYVDGLVCTITGEAADTVGISVTAPPTITELMGICNQDNESYQASFTVATEGDIDYTVEGTTEGTLVGNVFTTVNLPNDSTYNVRVVDANGCTTVVPQVRINCADCETNTGTGVWNNGDLTFCESTDIVITERPVTFVADENDRISFRLYAQDTANTVTQLARIESDPDNEATFPGISILADYDTADTYYIVVALGNSDGSGPENSMDRCLSIDTIPLNITSAPEPIIEVLTPGATEWEPADGLEICANQTDVQFRVQSGLNEPDRYEWDILSSGGGYNDNPYNNHSTLSLNLDDDPGFYSIAVTETIDAETACFGTTEFTYQIVDESADETDREVYLISSQGNNVLVVAGDEGCTYQWGTTDANGDENPVYVEEETFQSYTISDDAFDTDRNIYWVDVSCGGSCQRRYYYNRILTQINIPILTSTEGPVAKTLGNVRVTPNPNLGDFRLSLTGFATGDYRVDLYDPIGRVVVSRNYAVLAAGSNDFDWSLPGNSVSGLYFLRVTDKVGNVVTTKVSVNR